MTETLLFVLCVIFWILMGQGLYGYLRRARKEPDMHLMCLVLWPILLLLMCFLDSTLDW